MLKNDFLEKTHELLMPNFEDLGFSSNKYKDIYSKKEEDFKFNFEINITPKEIQHLTLSVENKKIGNIFKKVEQEIANEQKKTIFKGVRPICTLTDWKKLYKNENLDLGSIWFMKFSNLNEIEEHKNEYLLAVELAVKWFCKCKDLNFVYDYNFNKCFTVPIEMALCIGKYLNKNIKRDFDDFAKKNEKYLSWNKNEVDFFLKHLDSYDASL